MQGMGIKPIDKIKNWTRIPSIQNLILSTGDGDDDNNLDLNLHVNSKYYDTNQLNALKIYIPPQF